MKREHYEKHVRPFVKNGDIMLFRGRRLLARTIQFFDGAYYNHVGVVYESAGRFMIIDSNRRGVHPEFLSDRCMGYGDVGILRPAEKYTPGIPAAIETVMKIADDGVKYDFLLLPRIAIARKLGIDIKRLGADHRDICSEWTRRYAQALGATCYDNGTWITPQDFMRLRGTDFLPVLLAEE